MRYCEANETQGADEVMAMYSDAELETLMSDLESNLAERKESVDQKKIRRNVCAFANDLPGTPGRAWYWSAYRTMAPARTAADRSIVWFGVSDWLRRSWLFVGSSTSARPFTYAESMDAPR